AAQCLLRPAKRSCERDIETSRRLPRLSEEEKVWAIRLSALGRSVDENRSDARASQAVFSAARRRRQPSDSEALAVSNRESRVPSATRCSGQMSTLSDSA